MEEVEKKEGGSFPSNYVTIHQLRQRWLQQQSSSLSPVIAQSNHRDDDDDDVESSSSSAAAAKKKPQNDVVSAAAVRKSPAYNNNNKASSSSNSNQQRPPLSPISSSSSSGGFKKKPSQNDAVSPPAKTKSSSYNSNNNNKPPLISQQNHHHHNEIVSKTQSQSIPPPHFRRGHRLLAPQKPKTQPADNLLATTNLNTSDSANDDVDNHINTVSINKILSKKKNYKKTPKAKGVFPYQNRLIGPETDPNPGFESESELEAVVEKEQKSRGRRKSNKKAARESKMAPESVMEVEQVVVEKKQPRESRGRRDWDKKVGREFKDKTASCDQNKHDVVEPELKVEMDVEAVVDKRQKPTERRNRDNKTVREFIPKTASFGGQYDYNNVGVGGVEVDKVVGDGNVVKQNSRRGSGNFDHQGQGQGQGKHSLKAASFDHHQDIMNETAVLKSGDNTNNYNININNVTGDGGSNWRRGSGRFRGQGIRKPLYLKPLVEMRKGQVWVKKGESD